jgi:beta-N-acetylhexosaminidase
MVDSLRDATGQLFFFNFSETSVTPEVERFVEQTRPGGVILFGHNLRSAGQVRDLNRQLQQLARRLDLPPFIIAVDDEGGRVTRMPNDMRALTAPSPMAQAAAGGPPVAAACATATARRLRRLGFTMDFAPVADVNNNPLNPIIGSRAFGGDPAVVGEYVVAAVTAFLEGGIAPCAKHFPGHGDTTVDSHLDLPVVHKTLDELAAVELVPFARAIAAGVPAIMTAHIVYPEADPSGRPATLSPRFMQHLLRERMGFDGLLFTDSLSMLAILAKYDLAEATRWALEAGACLLGPNGGFDIQMTCYDALIRAAEVGAFDVAAAATRVAAHKARFVAPLLAALDSPLDEARAAEEIADEADALATVARRSVTLLRNRGGVLPINPASVQRPLLVDFDSIIVSMVEGAWQPGPVLRAALEGHLPGLRTWAHNAPYSVGDAEEALRLAAEADLLLIVTRNAARHADQAALAARLIDLGKPSVLIAAREPYDVMALPAAPAYVVTYSDPPTSLLALVDLLFGAYTPAGRLPVAIPDQFPVGAGLTAFQDLMEGVRVTTVDTEQPTADFVPYTPEQMPALLEIWDAATEGRIPLSPALWRQRVDEDPLFSPADCFILPAGDDTLAGFALTRILPEWELAANPDLRRHEGPGHLMALAVHPRYARQGIGSRLLAAAEARLRSQGATSITLQGPANHLVPGLPVASDSLPFWERRGYTEDGISADLRRRLDDWESPPPPPAVAAGDFAYRQGHPGEEDAIVEFMARAFPGNWRYTISRYFARGYAPEDMTLLVDRTGRIEGFLCTFHPASAVLGGGSLYYPAMDPVAWGGIGPLGVSPEVRNLKLGLGLVAAGVDYLYHRGVRDCGIDWTTLIGFYGRLGFTVWQEYYKLDKP